MAARRAAAAHKLDKAFWLSMGGVILTGALNIGMNLQQFEQVKETLKHHGGDIRTLNERQVANITNVQNLQTAVANHEQRIIVIERTFYQTRGK